MMLVSDRFGGFLRHRAVRLRRLSTGCDAMSPRQNVHRTDNVGVFLVAAIHAQYFACVSYRPTRGCSTGTFDSSAAAARRRASVDRTKCVSVSLGNVSNPRRAAAQTGKSIKFPGS
jgi:hypothetical protein